MPLPPWTVELLRRSITDVARKASEPETLEKIKKQATEILQDLPATAARSIDAVMRTAEAGKRTVEETVDRWTRKQNAVEMINASGVLMHDLGSGVPLSEKSIQAGNELLRGDLCGGVHSAQSASDALCRRVEALLPGDAECGVAIASNFAAAMTAFSQLVQERELVIHRSHAVRLPNGQPLPDAFGTLLPVIQEVGSVGDVSVSDYDGIESFCTIMADAGKAPVEYQDFGDRDAMQAVVLPVATFVQSCHTSIPSASTALANGADFVLMPGGGVCGGPECGLLIGRKDALATIVSSPAWPALRASDALQAMLAVSLESIAADPESCPIHALLDTAIENLNSRAERMAARFAGSDDIEACRITENDALLTKGGQWKIASRQLVLKHRELNAADWSKKLQENDPAVVAEVSADEIKIDLRWVNPARDNQLATLLSGQTSEGNVDTNESS